MRHNLNRIGVYSFVIICEQPFAFMPVITSLSDLAIGMTAVIQDMPTGHDAYLTRLRELGLVPGTKVRLVRRAPLGDPIEISVRGSRLAMRCSEAKHIKILPE